MKIIRNFIILIVILGMNSQLNAQKVRWSYKIENSVNGYGKPWKWTAGFNDWAAAVEKEDVEGEKLKKKAKDPEMIHFYFMPFNAQQLIVFENYNPGAISKIEIDYRPDMQSKKQRKVVYEAETKRDAKDYIRRNIYFDMLNNITDVWVYMDYVKVPGVNQIAGVALADFKEEYKGYINTPDENAFVGEPMYMNDDVSGKASPTTPIITVDNRYIYFNHNNEYEQIYRGTIGSNGKIEKVEYSKFNLPFDKSSASGISAVSQDNNAMFVNAMTIGKMEFYKIYLGTNLMGNPKWKFDKISVNGFNNSDDYQNDLMSYDGKYLICRQVFKKGKYSEFDGELFVFTQKKNGDYGSPIHLGFDINSIWDEIPCYLAPDNKTLFFASNGHLGYGQKDIYMSRRLDETWQNWSRPVNLGKPINSDKHENYFILDSQAEYAYFIRWKDGSDLYRIELAKPKEEVKEKPAITIKPEPVIVIKGIVLDKKTDKPVYATITYTDLETDNIMGTATSNAETGEYSIALPMGINYSFEANAAKYITVSENVNSKGITECTIIEKNLYLVPIEVGQTVRLNNIFFETAKAEIKKESDKELNKLLMIMKTNPKLKIEISGHTDNVGSDTYNMKLSEDRAKAVVEWLTKHEIEPSRIIAKGYGETKPVVSNDTEEGKARNRRVEFTILEN